MTCFTRTQMAHYKNSSWLVALLLAWISVASTAVGNVLSDQDFDEYFRGLPGTEAFAMIDCPERTEHPWSGFWSERNKGLLMSIGGGAASVRFMVMSFEAERRILDDKELMAHLRQFNGPAHFADSALKQRNRFMREIGELLEKPEMSGVKDLITPEDLKASPKLKTILMQNQVSNKTAEKFLELVGDLEKTNHHLVKAKAARDAAIEKIRRLPHFKFLSGPSEVSQLQARAATIKKSIQRRQMQTSLYRAAAGGFLVVAIAGTYYLYTAEPETQKAAEVSAQSVDDQLSCLAAHYIGKHHEGKP